MGLSPRTSDSATNALSLVFHRYELITLTAAAGGGTPPPGGGAPGGGGGGGTGSGTGGGGTVGGGGSVNQGSSSNQSSDGGGGGAAGPVIGVIIAMAVVGGFVYWYTKVRPRTHSSTPATYRFCSAPVCPFSTCWFTLSLPCLRKPNKAAVTPLTASTVVMSNAAGAGLGCSPMSRL